MIESLNNINSISKDKCTGCMACLHSCPQKCISSEWIEGFEYPKCDESVCFNCGICTQSCPLVESCGLKEEPRVIGAINKNEEIRINSSSGGVFYELAMRVLRDGGVVCGAGFNDSMTVVHKIVEDEAGISDLMRSKYVQSNLGECYPQIKKLLIEGREVLFVGTPCQVNGLHSFLGKEYENLIMVDLICHGVPSPVIWECFVEEMEHRHGSKCMKVSFRDMSIEGWHNFGMRITFDDGNTYVDTQNNNMYMKGFLYGYYDRMCCYDCQFKGLNRSSDITLGDFWSVKRYLENLDDNKGTSLIYINTNTGERAFRSVENAFEYKDLDKAFLFKYSGAYSNSEIDVDNRKKFYARYEKGEAPFDIIRGD